MNNLGTSEEEYWNSYGYESYEQYLAEYGNEVDIYGN